MPSAADAPAADVRGEAPVGAGRQRLKAVWDRPGSRGEVRARDPTSCRASLPFLGTVRSVSQPSPFRFLMFPRSEIHQPVLRKKTFEEEAKAEVSKAVPLAGFLQLVVSCYF